MRVEIQSLSCSSNLPNQPQAPLVPANLINKEEEKNKALHHKEVYCKINLPHTLNTTTKHNSTLLSFEQGKQGGLLAHFILKAK